MCCLSNKSYIRESSRQYTMWFPLLARNRDKAHCAICNKELSKFKYKPRKEWNMVGSLCGDCHIKKTLEFSGENEDEGRGEWQDRGEKKEQTPLKCGVCNREVTSEMEQIRPKWKWNMDTNLILCKRCYTRKDLEHEKRINYCSLCGSKMSFFRYNPKPKWKIEGQLCRRCWDNSNARWKDQN